MACRTIVPVIVDQAIYRDGRRHEIVGDISDTFAKARTDGDALLWIGLHEPTQDEFDLITDELGLHPLAVEDAIHAHQRPKLERYGDSVFVVLKTLRQRPGASQLDVGEIMLFIGPDFVVTVRHGTPNPLQALRIRVEADAWLLRAGPAGVLYAICDLVIDTYAKVVAQVETDLIDVERQIFEEPGGDVTAAIHALKRRALQCRAAVDPLVPVLDDLAAERVELCTGLPEYFRNALDHLVRVDRQADSHGELLTSALTAHLALVTVRQNTDVRRISAWAAVVAVPTMVFGIYGMNFDHMPELGWTFGYPMVIVATAVACRLIHARMRKSGWL